MRGLFSEDRDSPSFPFIAVMATQCGMMEGLDFWGLTPSLDASRRQGRAGQVEPEHRHLVFRGDGHGGGGDGRLHHLVGLAGVRQPLHDLQLESQTRRIQSLVVAGTGGQLLVAQSVDLHDDLTASTRHVEREGGLEAVPSGRQGAEGLGVAGVVGVTDQVHTQGDGGAVRHRHSLDADGVLLGRIRLPGRILGVGRDRGRVVVVAVGGRVVVLVLGAATGRTHSQDGQEDKQDQVLHIGLLPSWGNRCCPHEWGRGVVVCCLI